MTAGGWGPFAGPSPLFRFGARRRAREDRGSDGGTRLRVRLLGAFAATRGDAVLAVPGARLRGLTLRLALAGGRPAEPGILVGAIWAEYPPAGPAHALQALVSRLRRTLGSAGDVVQAAGGYRLEVAAADVDALRFEQLAAAGREHLRAGDPNAAAAALPLRAQLRQYDDDFDGALADLRKARSLAGEFGSLSLGDELSIDLRWIDLYLRRGDTGRALAIIGSARERALRAASPEMPALVDAREGASGCGSAIWTGRGACSTTPSAACAATGCSPTTTSGP